MSIDAERQQLIYQSDFWSIHAADTNRIIVVVRHREPFESEGHCHEVTQPVQDVLDSCGRETVLLLIDSRTAPPRNDPKYEESFSRHRGQMVEGFERAAVLMKSVAGLLQTQRLSGAEPRARPAARVGVFVDEAEARAFLLGLD